MKAILLSVQPKWVEKILNVEKTIEIRKTAPKFALDYTDYALKNKGIEVYIYCTKGAVKLFKLANDEWITAREKEIQMFSEYSGKVVAKFVLREVENIFHKYNNKPQEFRQLQKNACLTESELFYYAGNDDLFAWHISDLQIFDKPMELRNFYRECKFYDCCDCGFCQWDNDLGQNICVAKNDFKLMEIKRPPQSWQYCEINQ